MSHLNWDRFSNDLSKSKKKLPNSFIGHNQRHLSVTLTADSISNVLARKYFRAQMIFSATSSRRHSPFGCICKMMQKAFNSIKPKLSPHNTFSAVCKGGFSEKLSVHIPIIHFKSTHLLALTSLHHNTSTCLHAAPGREVFLPRHHGTSSQTSLLQSIMIASITSCGVVSPLQAGFPLSGPSQNCTGDLQRGVIARVRLYLCWNE